MSRLTKAAITAAAALAIFSVADAVFNAATGGNLADDEGGPPWSLRLIGAALTVTFGLLAAVLVQAARTIDQESRYVHAVRRALVAVLVVLATASAISSVLADWPGPLTAVAAAGFPLIFLLGAALGVPLLRRPAFRVPALMLLASIPVLIISAIVEAVAPGWGHPAYAETLLYLGLALLGTVTTHTADTPSSLGHSYDARLTASDA